MDNLPPAPNEAIARSRSRYKGPRSTRHLIGTDQPPRSSAAESQRLQGAASTHRRERSKAYPAPAESVAEPRSDPRKIAANHETLNAEIEPQLRIRGDLWLEDQTRRENFVEIPSPDSTGQIRKSSIEPQKLLERESREDQAILRLRGREEQPTENRLTPFSKRSLTKRVVGQTTLNRREELKRTISGPIVIEPPQSIVAPAFDAPVSAVNAGERRVTIRYEDSTLSLPVMPSTTPMDIIRLASEQAAESISSKTSIVVETYGQLGLERPLRKYERIRNVMNSWDHDVQNTLMITQSPTLGEDEDLELKCVSRSRPGDISVSIYHSQKPGHWDKRWVTLRSDGQILIAKRDGAETSNICHLSDFDIYIPTARQLSKKIRPPRKMCFAIKSQQKSSMFLTTVNFVHFFSTGDKALAAAWYKAVQEWRSWYLVNVMGEGLETAGSPLSRTGIVDHEIATNNQPRVNNGGRSSVGSGDPRIGTADDVTCGQAICNRGPRPPISCPRKLTKDAETGAPMTHREGLSLVQTSQTFQQEPEPFATTGLLGRTYTQRQKARQKLDISQTLGSSPPIPMPTAPSPLDGLKRASSQRLKTKPLLDLTPQHQELPQHAKKGRGFLPEHIPLGGLVEIATGPEDAIPLPPTSSWQRPGTSSGQDGPTIQRSRTVGRNQGASCAGGRQKSQSPGKGKIPFTIGLLAGHSNGQGGAGIGRGITTGDRQAKAPMLDVKEESNYAPGSLLHRAEERDGGPRPVIERDKRREVNAAVGKGM